MPTPFTHLAIAQRLLDDTEIPQSYRILLTDHLPAFLLGSIVADARVSTGIGRELTHFYSYETYIIEHPWRVMLDQHRSLCVPKDDDHRAFLAGYVAHLAIDEAWALKIVRPYFVKRDWTGVSRQDRFLALHLILTHMDERDEAHLAGWQADTLQQSIPDGWLPFMPDEVLWGWRDLIASQISTEGSSQTLQIFGQRLSIDPLRIRGLLDDKAEMFKRLWQYVPQKMLYDTEALMYAYSRDQLCWYLSEYP